MSNSELREKGADQPGVTLEQLLRLKKVEKPGPEFWARFDKQMQQRSLQALVEQKPTIFSRTWGYLAQMRPVAIPGLAAVLLVVGLSLSSDIEPEGGIAVRSVFDEPALSEFRELPSQPVALESRGTTAVDVVAAPEEPMRSRFVVDVLSNSQENLPFRKVLAAAPMTFEQENVRYVADPLGAATGRVLASTPSF